VALHFTVAPTLAAQQRVAPGQADRLDL